MNTALRITMSARQRIAAAWQGLTLRERRLLMLGSASLVVLICWFWVIDPAIKTRKKMQQQLPELRAQAAHLRAPELQAAGIRSSLVGGAFEASELDAKRAIDQASRLAAVV